MQQVRDDDALMPTIHSAFGDVMAPLGHVAHRVQVTSTLLKGMGAQVAATMLPDELPATSPPRTPSTWPPGWSLPSTAPANCWACWFPDRVNTSRDLRYRLVGPIREPMTRTLFECAQ